MDSGSPRLSAAFRQASGPAIVQAGGHGVPALRSALAALAEELDDKYFKLEEEADARTPESLLYFRRARAVAALAFGLSPDIDDASESVYEAIASSDEKADILPIIESALSAQ